MKNRLLLILFASIITGLCVAQTHKTYTGTYPDGRDDSHKGTATYSYIEGELGQRIYDGPCTFTIKNFLVTETAKGQFKNDEKDGRWVYTSKGGYTQTIIANYKNGLYDGAYSFEEKDPKTGRINRSVKATFRNDGLVGNLVYTSGSDTYIKGQYDDQGRKQGKWEHQYRGEVKYTYLFKDDVCTKGIKMNVQTGDVSDARFDEVESYWEFQRHYSLENMIRRSRYHGWTVGGKASATLGRKPLDVGQESKDQSSSENVVDETEEIKVYDVVEVMPSFPEGQAALMRFISSNLKYPSVAEENGIQGRVLVTVVVNKDGSITDVKISSSPDPSLSKEAERLVKSMPKWIPGKQGGVPVAVKYTIPVTFRLP